MTPIIPGKLEQVRLEFSQLGVGYWDGQGLEQVEYFWEDRHFYCCYSPQKGDVVLSPPLYKGPNVAEKGGEVLLIEGGVGGGNVDFQVLQRGGFPAIRKIGS